MTKVDLVNGHFRDLIPRQKSSFKGIGISCWDPHAFSQGAAMAIGFVIKASDTEKILQPLKYSILCPKEPSPVILMKS